MRPPYLKHIKFPPFTPTASLLECNPTLKPSLNILRSLSMALNPKPFACHSICKYSQNRPKIDISTLKRDKESPETTRSNFRF